MKQYCRYCCFLFTSNGIWCGKKSREISEATAKSLNKCHSFSFTPIDAFGSIRRYTPKKPKKASSGKRCDGKQCDGQMSLF